MIKDIVKGSDEEPLIQIPRKQGTFRFNETGFTQMVCELFDKDGTSIHSFNYTGNTLVPVTISYSATENIQLTADINTDWFVVRLLGSYTTNSASGRIRAKITITWTNTNFTDDSTKDKIMWFYTNYNLIADA